MNKKANALFPFTTSPLDFRVGDFVKKIGPGFQMHETVGVVSHLLPKSFKVRVQWPYGNEIAAPEEVYAVNRRLFPATVTHNTAYDSWENRESERLYGALPRRPKQGSLGLRIADAYISKLAHLTDYAFQFKKMEMSGVATYLKMSSVFGKEFGDTVIREAVSAAYGDSKE